MWLLVKRHSTLLNDQYTVNSTLLGFFHRTPLTRHNPLNCQSKTNGSEDNHHRNPKQYEHVPGFGVGDDADNNFGQNDPFGDRGISAKNAGDNGLTPGQ